jgi:hypothetical protein
VRGRWHGGGVRGRAQMEAGIHFWDAESGFCYNEGRCFLRVQIFVFDPTAHYEYVYNNEQFCKSRVHMGCDRKTINSGWLSTMRAGIRKEKKGKSEPAGWKFIYPSTVKNILTTGMQSKVQKA